MRAVSEHRDVRDAHVLRQCRRIDGEAVILAGDDDLTRILVEHRMICAVMAELHLHRFRAGCESEQLVAATDAERQSAAIHEFATGLERVVARPRHAGPGRKGEAVGADGRGDLETSWGAHDGRSTGALIRKKLIWPIRIPWYRAIGRLATFDSSRVRLPRQPGST